MEAGGEELAVGVARDLLYNDRDSSVSALILRAYSAVSVEGGGRARVAWSNVGFRPSPTAWTSYGSLGSRRSL